MRIIHRYLVRGTLAVVSHPKLTLAIAGLALAGSVVFAATRLTLSTDQNKLFSSNVRFFRDWLEFVRKFPENEAIYIIVEQAPGRPKPPTERWVAAAEAIAQRLRSMPRHVRSVENRIPLDQLGNQGILFEYPDRLAETVREAKQFEPLLKLWGEKPTVLTGLLGSTPIQRLLGALATRQPDPQIRQFVDLLAGSLTEALRYPEEPLVVGRNVPDLSELNGADPSSQGYFTAADATDPQRQRRVMLIRVYPREVRNSLTAQAEVVNAIRDAVAEVASGFPQFSVGVTGRPVLEADEMLTTDRDTHRAEIVALSVIFVGLILMFRSIWLAALAELTLAVAIGWTFGWATLAVGELNLLSIVFLIALIGIGMDYLIQVLMAYQREARRYQRATAIWTRVFHYISPPIVTAGLGAASAFLVAMLTDFRGAAELGIIAGVGLLLCLLAGHTVLPAMLVLLPARQARVDPAQRYQAADVPAGANRWRLLTPALWVLAVLGAIPLMLRARFDPNLIDLQAPNLKSVQLVRKLETWSAVVLSRNLEDLRRARQALEGAASVAGTESLLLAQDNYAWLQEHAGELPEVQWASQPPVTPADLPRIRSSALALAERLGDTAASLRALAGLIESQNAEATAQRLTAWQQRFTAELRTTLAKLDPPPLDLERLPRELRGRYVSEDGIHVLYIYPSADLWQQRELERFVTEIESRVAAAPGDLRVTGIAHNIYHSTAAVERAFHKATVYAFILIFILVLIDLRRLGQTLGAISVLGLGLPMLVAIMGLAGINWNFANFFALPILIGAGHEYGVFMIHRYREALHDRRRTWRRWDASDRALLLCAFVTSSSFGFFWLLGHHRGLRSLGLVMALGSACIYLATILALRPALVWLLERRRQRDGAHETGPRTTDRPRATEDEG